MGEIVVGGAKHRRQDPPRPGLMLVGVAAVVGVLVLVSGVGKEIPPDEPLDISAATEATVATTTIPLDLEEVVPVPRLLPSVTLTMADLLRGPRLQWSELELPDALTSVFAVGEFRGSAVVVGSIGEPDAYGRTAGAVVYIRNGGEWGDQSLVFGPGRYATAAEIGQRGFVVVSDEGRGFGLASDIRIHSSIGGLFWSETAIARDGTYAVVRGIASDDLSTWVLVDLVPDLTPPVVEALPDEIRGLLGDPFIRLEVEPDGQVSVSFLDWIDLYTTSLDELDVQLDPDDLESEPIQFGLWVSRDSFTFNESPLPLAGSFSPRGISGSSGLGIYLLGNHEGLPVLVVSTDGSTWQEADGLAPTAPIQVNGLDHITITQRGISGVRSFEVRGGDAPARHIVEILAEGVQSGHAVVGPAGYLLPTSGQGTTRPAPVRIESGELTVIVEGRFFALEDGDGEVISYSLWGNAPFGVFDVAAGEIEILRPDDSVFVSLPLGVISSILASGGSAIDQTSGVLFTPDGEQWGWSPLVDLFSESPGRITAAAIGQTDVYVVTSDGRFSPFGFGSLEPRLFVGRPIG